LGPLGDVASARGGPVPIGAATYTDRHTVEQELPRAREVYNEAQEVVNRIREDVGKNRVFDARRATVLVNGLVDSIIANPEALMLLLMLKQEAESAFDQAVMVAVNILAFGRQLGLPRDELSVLGLAGILLDVGMVQLPKELLAKKTLTPTEHAIVKRHVGFSQDLLRKSQGVPERVVEIVGEHHEREDGSGYPRGLIANEISVYGKMAAIADCYRELTTGTHGRLRMSAYEALEMMHGWSGRFFHPTLVEQFIQSIGIYPVGSLVELNTGDVAIVMEHSRTRRMQPRVMLILDPKKRPYATPKAVDLAHGSLSDAGVPYEITRGLERGAHGIDPKDYYL
ncbi:MAG TPA: HD domain-containing phosphohydrolase, partial [Burkholderiales bacterium]|nr:HD domain-containing phosphohydrolase [Burkholderiales bacterium]